jgi:hypothetical protein
LLFLLPGRMGPEYVSLELNLGGSVVSSALCEVCGVSRGQLREMYKQYGDLGDVAQVGEGCMWSRATWERAYCALSSSGFHVHLHTICAHIVPGFVPILLHSHDPSLT